MKKTKERIGGIMERNRFIESSIQPWNHGIIRKGTESIEWNEPNGKEWKRMDSNGIIETGIESTGWKEQKHPWKTKWNGSMEHNRESQQGMEWKNPRM